VDRIPPVIKEKKGRRNGEWGAGSLDKKIYEYTLCFFALRVFLPSCHIKHFVVTCRHNHEEKTARLEEICQNQGTFMNIFVDASALNA